MTALRYEVVVADTDDGYVARIEELGCAAIGTTVEEALTLVREQALVVLRDFSDTEPPCPLRQVIVPIEVPNPRGQGLAAHLGARGTSPLSETTAH
jgi:predicted RNase H-like HicB family nuclease